MERFKRNHLKIARNSFSGRDLKLQVSDADLCIVGSDQVWNPEACPCLENYFFDFIKKDSKIKKLPMRHHLAKIPST